MGFHYEIRFSGSGGQGMMRMGDISAEAAGCIEGKEILLTRSYGPESRGGACRSELILDDEEITYPAVTKPNFVLAMTQQSHDQYTKDMAEDGILLVDSEGVKNINSSVARTFALPITAISKEVTGKEIAANIVALGAFTALSGVVGKDAMISAMHDAFSENLAGSNDKAFEAGYAAASELIKK